MSTIDRVRSIPAAPPRSEQITVAQIEQIVHRALAAQLQVLRHDLADVKKAAVMTNALTAAYQMFRLAFFGGRPEPLAFGNVDQLVFASMLNDIRFVGYDEARKRVSLMKDGVVVTTDAYFYIFLEVFAKQEYQALRRLVDRPFVVYDLGMNRGYASLWFAAQPECVAVHGFEPFEEAYNWAQSNFALNPALANKIKSSPFGLGGENKTVELHYEDVSDGVSTVVPDFYASFWTDQRKARVLKRTVTLRKASEVLAELPPRVDGQLRVLKIDVEGAEYEIVEDLIREKQFDFDIVLAEAHLGLDRFLALLPGYRVVEALQHSDLVANVVLVRQPA